MKTDRILHLTLKKKWFDMIKQGVKKEEYREIKPYWTKRLKDFLVKNPFDYVLFRNGYSKDAPTLKVECKGVKFGEARPEWSDGAKGRFYVIQLGEIL